MHIYRVKKELEANNLPYLFPSEKSEKTVCLFSEIKPNYLRKSILTLTETQIC